jgi:hypothetical protein
VKWVPVVAGLTGIVMESVADYQKSAFRSEYGVQTSLLKKKCCIYSLLLIFLLHSCFTDLILPTRASGATRASGPYADIPIVSVYAPDISCIIRISTDTVYK